MKKKRHWEQRQFDQHRRHNRHFAKPGVHDFVVVLDHLKASFNIGKIFRSCDAFGAKEVHLIGTEFFSTRSAKGAFKHVPAHFHETFAACHEQLAKDGYTFFILSPDAKQGLQQTALPQKSAFIFGHEEIGVSFEMTDFPEIQTIVIPQYGKVESLNVSIAASLAMYEYLRQHADGSS